MSRWQTEHMELSKNILLKTKEDLPWFCRFALLIPVDYVYVLETIKKFLNGKRG